MTAYRALTIWQPWASLIAAGAKPYEWRGRPPPRRLIGQRIAIHAGSRRPKSDELNQLWWDLTYEDPALTSLVPNIAQPLMDEWLGNPKLLPLSSVLCIATLGEPITAAAYAQRNGLPARDSDRIDHQKWGWPLTDIEMLEPFVPAKGAQGFWNWERPST